MFVQRYSDYQILLYMKKKKKKRFQMDGKNNDKNEINIMCIFFAKIDIP